jgi:hypothetical protein
MSAKTSNLLNILAAFGMIAAGIIAIYDEDMLFTAIGIYFICKGLFVNLTHAAYLKRHQKQLPFKYYEILSLSKA